VQYIVEHPCLASTPRERGIIQGGTESALRDDKIIRLAKICLRNIITELFIHEMLMSERLLLTFVIF
jgi:hypothetical protein